VVVVTLVYLTIQIRQGNALRRSQSRQSQLTNDQTSLMVAFDNVDILGRMNSDEPLSEEEQMRLAIVYLIDMRNREFEYFQHKAGLLDEDAWNSFRELIVVNHVTKKGRLWWDKVGRTVFDAGFVASVDALLEGAAHDTRMSEMGSWDSP
jgi:hypothetical protein